MLEIGCQAVAKEVIFFTDDRIPRVNPFPFHLRDDRITATVDGLDFARLFSVLVQFTGMENVEVVEIPERPAGVPAVWGWIANPLKGRIPIGPWQCSKLPAQVAHNHRVSSVPLEPSDTVRLAMGSAAPFRQSWDI